MNTLSEKVAYIKGLADGMALDETKGEVKLIKSILDVLAEMADEVQDTTDILDCVSSDVEDLVEHVDAVDCDLADLEEAFYDDYDDEFDDDFFNEDDEDEDDEVTYEIDCPFCGQPVEFDEEFLADSDILSCPACGKSFSFSKLLDEAEAEEEDN